jgi:hypothetical protein
LFIRAYDNSVTIAARSAIAMLFSTSRRLHETFLLDLRWQGGSLDRCHVTAQCRYMLGVERRSRRPVEHVRMQSEQ